jgi:hypothetical protein
MRGAVRGTTAILSGRSSLIASADNRNSKFPDMLIVTMNSHEVSFDEHDEQGVGKSHKCRRNEYGRHDGAWLLEICTYRFPFLSWDSTEPKHA